MTRHRLTSPLSAGTMTIHEFFAAHQKQWIKNRYAMWLITKPDGSKEYDEYVITKPNGSKEYDEYDTKVPANAVPCYCLEGALDDRYGQFSKERDEASRRVRKVIANNPEWQARVGKSQDFIHIPEFNDHPRTTVDDIIEVARLAEV